MNENIDLTKILKGCPKGTELYSTIYGKVRFEGISNSDLCPIEIKFLNKFTNPSLVSAFFAKDGRCSSNYDGECTLFPAKDQRDWSKFERFWDKQKVEKFDANIDLIKILEGCPKGTEFYHVGFGKVWFVGIDLDNEYSSEGPILFSLHNDTYYADTALTKKGTFSMLYEGECLIFPSKDQRDWTKFERFWDNPKVEKFDVNTLQPFDKVLVRNYNNVDWQIGLFGYKCGKCIYSNGTVYYQCIPYNDETKHLLGTANDCTDYYKWWEE